MLFTSASIHPELLKACQNLTSKKKTVVKQISPRSDKSFIPMSEEDLNDMFPEEDLYDDDEYEEKVEVRPKKKKKKVQLSPEELAIKEKAKEERKARKAAMKKAREDAERIRREQKEAKRAEERKQQAKIASIELVARKKYLINKLYMINPNKKKSAAKIADIRIEIEDINTELNRLRTEFGIEIEDVNEDSKVGGFFKRLGYKIKHATKKTKKFMSDNSELILGLASVVLPVIGGIIFKTVSKS